jgi:exosortase/archaeosortase family protein
MGLPELSSAAIPVRLIALKFVALSLMLLVGWACVRQTAPARELVAYAVVMPAGWLSNLVGESPTVTTTDSLSTPRGSILVRPGCEGVELMLLVSAAVIAWPGSARRRLIGIAVALMLLTIANDLRLAVLLKAIEVDRARFEWLHSFGGPVLLVAIAAGFLMFWTRPLGRGAQ